MKSSRIHIALLVIAFGAFFAALFIDASTSWGQSQSDSRATRRLKSDVKPTASVRRASVPSSPAASRNLLLSTELNWIFGGKPQRGWFLYSSLIGSLLETEHDIASDKFVSALSQWQKKAGLTSSGVLDEDSLYAMISRWQGQRLKDRSPARPDQLITAPASDFYDPARLDELRQIERETYAAYKRMVAAAVKDSSLGLARGDKDELAPTEKFLKIISSFRTREYQEHLRKTQPHAGSAGLAVNSPHFTGRALDLYVGGEPVETNDPNRSIQVQTPVYQWLVRNAARFGFRPYYYEPWHWEYVGK
jgi:D-alanyl-D-alanine carboxypeptidase